VRNLRERLSSSRRGSEPASKRNTERPNPLRVNEEEIFRQYMLAQAEPKVKEPSSRKKEEISGENIPSEYDATGRMIRPKTQEKKSVQLKAAEKEARTSLEFFKRNDRKLSAKFLNHYLNGSGKPLKMTAEEINNSPRLSDAVAQNNRRFEDSITKGLVDPKLRDGKFFHRVEGTPSPFKNMIENMKDGETIDLVNRNADSSAQPARDFWDNDLTPNPLLSVIPGLDKDPDQTLSTGSVKVRSLGNLQATRKGNKVKITGDVFHTLIDRYDFDLETPIEQLNFKNEKLLATEGKAKPFFVTGVKPQQVQGVLTLEKGRIKDWKFKWINTKF